MPMPGISMALLFTDGMPACMTLPLASTSSNVTVPSAALCAINVFTAVGAGLLLGYTFTPVSA